MKKYETQEESVSPFLEKFLSGPGVIDSIRLNRINRLVATFQPGRIKDHRGNTTIVEDGLVGNRIMRTVHIWENISSTHDLYTRLDLSLDEDPSPGEFRAKQEFYAEGEVKYAEAYSDAPQHDNDLSLRNVLSALKVAKRPAQAEQQAA
jgi:hypothetical protein